MDFHNASLFVGEGTSVEEYMRLLNEEMTCIGMPCLLSNRENQSDVHCLLDAAFTLLRRVQQAAQMKEELESRLFSCERETELYRAQNARHKEKVEGLSLENARLQEIKRQQTAQLEKLRRQVKTESDEVKRLGTTSTDLVVQYQHELRKKEHELVQLKERMSRSLANTGHPLRSHKKSADKDHCLNDSGFGYTASNILNHLPDRLQNGRLKECADVQTGIEEVYKTAIANLDEQRRLLVSENCELRNCLADVHKEIADLLSVCSSPKYGEVGENSCESDGSSSDCQDGHFLLPCSMMYDTLLKSFRRKCQLLRRKMSHIEDAPSKSGVTLFKVQPDVCQNEASGKVVGRVDKSAQSGNSEIIQQCEYNKFREEPTQLSQSDLPLLHARGAGKGNLGEVSQVMPYKH